MVDRLLVKRYFRLTIPVFLSCLIVFILMRFDCTFNVAAANILHREDWLGAFLQIDASVARLIKYSFIDVYTSHTRGKSFNPMLWTMSIEMVGSMLIFLACYAWRRVRHPVATIWGVAVFLMMLGSMYSLFFVGMGFSCARATGFFDCARKTKYITSLTWVGILLCVLLNAVFWGRSGSVMLFIPIAVFFVGFVYLNSWMRQFLSNRLSKHLGEISFPLYLTHFSILISVLSYGVVHVYGEYGIVNLSNVWGWILGALVLSYLLAGAFRYIEKYILFYVDKITGRMLIHQKVDIAEDRGMHINEVYQNFDINKRVFVLVMEGLTDIHLLPQSPKAEDLGLPSKLV